MADRARFSGLLSSYVKTAWWGLIAPRLSERAPLEIVQAIISRDGERDVELLLSVRSDLRGWELPGGTIEGAEEPEEALVREVEEETGLRVRVERHVGVYVRTGFRPHIARVYECTAVGGALRPSAETPRLDWHELSRLPDTLFPWYVAPLQDAQNTSPEPVTRREHQGLAAIVAGMRIDLRMRLSRDRAGRRRE